MNLSDAKIQAAQLGATTYAASYYPLRKGIFNRNPEVSFYYFFNAEGDEVANWCRDLSVFIALGGGFTAHNPPRKWHPDYLAELDMKGIEE